MGYSNEKFPTLECTHLLTIHAFLKLMLLLDRHRGKYRIFDKEEYSGLKIVLSKKLFNG